MFYMSNKAIEIYLSSFYKLLREGNYQPSIVDISKKAKFNRQNFYNYFETKEDFYRFVLTDYYDKKDINEVIDNFTNPDIYLKRFIKNYIIEESDFIWFSSLIEFIINKSLKITSKEDINELEILIIANIFFTEDRNISAKIVDIIKRIRASN